MIVYFILQNVLVTLTWSANDYFRWEYDSTRNSHQEQLQGKAHVVERSISFNRNLTRSSFKIFILKAAVRHGSDCSLSDRTIM